MRSLALNVLLASTALSGCASAGLPEVCAKAKPTPSGTKITQDWADAWDVFYAHGFYNIADLIRVGPGCWVADTYPNTIESHATLAPDGRLYVNGAAVPGM